jgi:hypothetical protein
MTQHIFFGEKIKQTCSVGMIWLQFGERMFSWGLPLLTAEQWRSQGNWRPGARSLTAPPQCPPVTFPSVQKGRKSSAKFRIILFYQILKVWFSTI